MIQEIRRYYDPFLVKPAVIFVIIGLIAIGVREPLGVAFVLIFLVLIAYAMWHNEQRWRVKDV